MSWLTFTISLIKLLTTLTTYFQSRGWIEQGRQEEREAALRTALTSLARANGVIAEFREKTDEDVDRELGERGLYRD